MGSESLHTWPCLTVHEPWASAIVDGHKTTENRGHACPLYTGVLLIHAGVRWSPRGGTDARIWAAYPSDTDRGATLRAEAEDWAGTPAPPFSSRLIIGVVEVAAAHRAAPLCCGDEWAETEYSYASTRARRESQPTHLVLQRARRFLEPVPYRGRLGLYRITDRNANDAVRAAVAAVA